MASALSEEEFHRMQLQLIELRTAKYELESLSKKQEREIQSLKESAETADKELQKAQKAISKSKKAKEVESLLQENEVLQAKLENQEEDFRVQNQTLMQELSTMFDTNESLEKQITELKASGNHGDGRSADCVQLEDEIRRLQAQNHALQRNVSVLQAKYETDGHDSNDDTKPNSGADPEEMGQSSGSAEAHSSSDTTEQPEVRSIDDLKLNLDTEKEENRMLKKELNEKEEKYGKELKILKEEIEKTTEKLKKKQESYIQLQDEKESIFKEYSEKLAELQASKDRDQKYYGDQITKLQQEVAKYHRLQEDMRSSSDQQIKQLQTKMAQMQQQIDAADIVESQHLQERSNKYESMLKELQSQILMLTQKRDDLDAQLQECQKASTEAAEQLCSLQKDRDSQILALQEANKIAEKRKTMLDDLAINYQKDCDKHREQMLALEDSLEAKLKHVHTKLEEEQKKCSELEKLRPLVEEQQGKITSLEESKGWLERRLEEAEGSLDKTLDENETTILTLKTEHDEEISTMKMSHSKTLDDLTETYQAQIHTLTGEKESQNDAINRLEDEVKKLKQEIKDGLNDKKVHEKKGKSVLKDLKKQLHAERKRTEKLQERLQEVLSSGTHNKGIEDLFRAPDVNDSWREDQSSVSSWSGCGSRTGTQISTTSHSILSTSPLSSPTSPITESPGASARNDETLTDSENRDLLNRLAALQQEKWDLEERSKHQDLDISIPITDNIPATVRHLETSTSAMANDLIEKSKIIQHYVMESRTDTKPHEDKISLKKVLDLVNKSDDQGLREMNKKLQNMLEESLTKNMHLQKDMETLSQEVVRLSKLPHQGSASSTDPLDLSLSENLPSTNDTTNHSSSNGTIS